MNNFRLGQIVATRAVAEERENNKEFEKEVFDAFKRYVDCDWGVTCDSDKRLNDSAVKNNDDRIVAKYETSKGDIFIITEYDRSYTTIMFTYEY